MYKALFVLICFKNVITNQQSVTQGDTSDIFSSTFQMQALLQAEIEFYNASSNEEPELQELIQSIYNDFVVPNNLEEYVSHPFNSFGIVSRTMQIKKFFTDNPEFQERYPEIVQRIRIFPPIKDYISVCSAIALIQETNEFNTSDLAQGNIVLENGKVFKSDYKLTINDQQAIGSVACQNHWYDTCIQWLTIALQNSNQNPNMVDLKDLKRTYKKAIDAHDKYLDTKGPVSKKHRTFPLPFDKNLRKKKKFKKKKALTKVEKVREYHPLFQYEIGQNLKDNNLFTCKEGEKWRTEKFNAKLKCYNLHHNDAYLKLGPFQLEEKNYDPYVVIFRQILHNSEISHFLSTAKNNLKRSLFGGSRTGLTRTSKQTWLHDKTFNLPDTFMEEIVPKGVKNPYKDGYLMAQNMKEPPALPANYTLYLKVIDKIAFKLSLKIQLATKLHLMGVFSSESYQIANYGIGGQYATHWDAAGYFEQEHFKDEKKLQNEAAYYKAVGDRFATFMAYLSDVQVGGKTAFPLLGVAADAVKGDAVFWINVKSSGKVHPLTAHSGCPVLIGSKWITNKWIQYYDQYEKFKCDLSEKLDNSHRYHLKFRSNTNQSF